MNIDHTKLRQVATAIGEAAQARRVILFGSHAKGNPDQDSDVDFLVIAESNQPRHKRSRHLYSLFSPYPFPMDILVYTPEEIERELKEPGSFVSAVISQGKELYAG